MNVVDRGLSAGEAVDAPRLHVEDGIVYAEPGVDVDAIERAGRARHALQRAQPLLRRCAGRGARPPQRDAFGRRRPAPRRRRGGGVRRAAAALLSLCSAAPSLGCGGPQADLFLVERAGSVPGARLTLLVSDGGTARCNRGEELPITSAQLIDAREIARELNGPEDERDGPADEGVRLDPAPGSVLTYDVRVEDGSVAFSDNSRGQPPVFYEVAKLTRDIAKEVCGLPR